MLDCSLGQMESIVVSVAQYGLRTINLKIKICWPEYPWNWFWNQKNKDTHFYYSSKINHFTTCNINIFFFPSFMMFSNIRSHFSLFILVQMAFWLFLLFLCTCVGVRMSTNQIVGKFDPMTIRVVVIIFRMTHIASGGCSERFKLSD